jgi:heme o synthase
MTTTTIAFSPRGRAADLLELAKPRMNLLVVATTMVGSYLAIRGRGDLQHVPATLVGTALCAAGAAVLNQCLERRRDALMVRTRGRPLPMGRVGPAEAVGYGLGLALGGVSLLALLVNSLTAALAAFTLLTYVLIYTPLKPRTTWNTLIGAVPGAIPPVMGWTAVRGELDPQALALFAILFCWQIPHFMAIAMLYRQDYAAAGFAMLPVKSLPSTGRQIVIFSLALIGVAISPTFLAMAGFPYMVAAILMSVAFLVVGVNCAVHASRKEARQLFLFSIIYLPALLTVMMIDRKL